MNTPNTNLDHAKATYKEIQLHAPSLDDQLRPEFQLLNQSCPLNRNGKCGNCDKFKGVILEDGFIWALDSYTGYCDSKNETIS